MQNELVKTVPEKNNVFGKLNKNKIRNIVAACIFLLPVMFTTVWLKYFLILKGIYISLFKYSPVTPPGEFIGLKNYARILNESFYWQSWRNTFVYLLLVFALVFILPIIQAILMSEIIKLRKLYTLFYIIPILIPVSVYVIIWKWIWNPDYGIANLITSKLGLGTHMWLSDKFWTKFCIIFPGTMGVVPGIISGGMSILLILAAILSINNDIYEAARIDGATAFQRIRYIVLPNIKFIIITLAIMTFIYTMQIFDSPLQFTYGGPDGAASSMSVYIYMQAYQSLDYGKSSAAATLLFIVILVFSFLQLKMDKQESE